MVKIARSWFFLLYLGVFLLSVSCEKPLDQETASFPMKSASRKEAVHQGEAFAGAFAEKWERKALPPPYDPKGRIDPFLPIIEKFSRSGKEENSLSERRFPQTPLEKIDLSGLRLVGIIGSSLGPSAVVEDASGRGYVVTLGTYMGIHSGQVTRIDKDHLIITEIIAGPTGEIREERRELKLRKPTEE